MSETTSMLTLPPGELRQLFAAWLAENPQDERSDPLTYSPDAPHSYFRDVVLAKRQHGDSQARLEQHAEEMRAELPKREQRARQAAAAAGLELRANPNRTAGQGGNFSPPLWLIDRFATAPRPGRVLAKLAPNFTLPPGVQSVNTPRLTTGTLADVSNDLNPTPDRDLVDAAVTSPVVTIDGETEVALQLLEQSPPGAHLDWALFKDLRESYDRRLEIQLLNGSGTNGQLTGLLNLPTGAGLVNAIGDTSGSPTGSQIFPLLGQAVAQIGDNRNHPPEAWMLRTARWAWLVTSEDTAGGPLSMPITSIPGSLFPLAEIAAFPAYLNDAIPANLGAGSNQDAIIACRPSDMIVLESDPVTRVMVDVVSGTLQARLQLYAFAAALLGRYPTGISVIGGTGTIIPAGF